MYSTYMISLIHELNRGNYFFIVHDVEKQDDIWGEFIFKQALMREYK